MKEKLAKIFNEDFFLDHFVAFINLNFIIFFFVSIYLIFRRYIFISDFFHRDSFWSWYGYSLKFDVYNLKEFTKKNLFYLFVYFILFFIIVHVATLLPLFIVFIVIFCAVHLILGIKYLIQFYYYIDPFLYNKKEEYKKGKHISVILIVFILDMVFICESIIYICPLLI